jgi:hypothetical protein
VLDAAAEVRQIAVQGGLTPRDDDPLQQPPALFEEREEILDREPVSPNAGRIDQLRVVAVRAAEIAACQKQDATDSAGVVDEGVFLKTADTHDERSPAR